MNHPQQKSDCPGELNLSPHTCGPRLLWKEKGMGWSCSHCKVYGKIEEDGTITIEGRIAGAFGVAFVPQNDAEQRNYSTKMP